VGAQLRDMLAAEKSAVVAEKYNHRWPAGPQRAEPDRLAVAIGQFNSCQSLAE
jgi:hypothetical protein